MARGLPIRVGPNSEPASQAADDNTLVVSYSGLGGQSPDENGDEDRGLNDTWCLYDGEMFDDELYGLWSKVFAGVRVAVLEIDPPEQTRIFMLVQR